MGIAMLRMRQFLLGLEGMEAAINRGSGKGQIDEIVEKIQEIPENKEK
jgi:hypothetical protein